MTKGPVNLDVNDVKVTDEAKVTIMKARNWVKVVLGKFIFGAGVPAPKTVEVPQLQFFVKEVNIPVVAQRQIFTVQTLQTTMSGTEDTL